MIKKFQVGKGIFVVYTSVGILIKS